MLLLALETADRACAACVFDTGAGIVLGEESRDIGKGHAEQLMDVIALALERSGATYASLGVVAVDVGPGSFTGVRTGVAAARGLALALSVPAIGVSSLEAIAAAARADGTDGDILAVIPARDGAYYTARYASGGGEVVAPCIAQPDDLPGLAEDALLTGPAAEAVAALTGAAASTVRDFARVDALARLAALKPVNAEKPRPLYLAGPGALPHAGYILPRKAG